MSDLVIEDHVFKYSGVSYFRDNAPSIYLGAYGRKRDKLGPKSYIEVQNRISREALKDHVRCGAPVTVNWAEQSSAEVDAQGDFKYFSASASGGINARYAKARSENLRLVYFHLDGGPLTTILNKEADGARKYLRDEGGDGRVVIGLWIAADHVVAETLETAFGGNGTVSVSAVGDGLSVSATANVGTKRTVTVTVGTGAFAYLLEKVSKWTKDDKVDEMVKDEHGAFQ